MKILRSATDENALGTEAKNHNNTIDESNFIKRFLTSQKKVTRNLQKDIS